MLGAGLAGLSTAYMLALEGFKVTVLEKSDGVGGLARSFQRSGYTYDYGPHRFHTGNPEVIDLITDLLGDNVGIRDRTSRIFMENHFFNYPLKLDNILKNLPVSVLVRSFVDFFAIKVKNLFVKPREDNFESWVLNRYGRTLYRMFFGVYTEKTWGIPCTQISADWASQRISLLSLWDAVKKTVFRPKVGNQPRTYVSKFWYPKHGGIGRISTRLAEEIEKLGGRIILGADVRELVTVGNRVETVVYSSGDEDREETPDALVSTIPITVLSRLITPGAPEEVHDATSRMKHRSMVFVYLALDRDRVTDDHWIYLPDDKLTVHRISEFKNFSEHNTPEGKTLLCCEITCDHGDEIWGASDENLREIAVKDLTLIGLLRHGDVEKSWTHRTRYAYPIYDLDYMRHLNAVKGFVDSIGNLYSAGRQGLFKYNNMDHSIEMGIEVSRDLRLDSQNVDRVASGSKYFG